MAVGLGIAHSPPCNGKSFARGHGAKPADQVRRIHPRIADLTYAAGICGPFKSFMDTTGRLWRQQLLDC
jgi:hypothetical protein